MPEKPQETFEPSRDKAGVAFDNDGPLVMIVTLPLDAYAKDPENGSALLRGKLEEAKVVAMGHLQNIRAKDAKGGLIKTAAFPAAGGIKPPISVH